MREITEKKLIDILIWYISRMAKEKDEMSTIVSAMVEDLSKHFDITLKK